MNDGIPSPSDHDITQVLPIKVSNEHVNRDTILEPRNEFNTPEIANLNVATKYEFDLMRERNTIAMGNSDNESNNQTITDELIREHVIYNAMSIKFKNDRYTTPITMEFRIKN